MTTVATPAPSMFAVFRKRDFSLLWLAQLVSTAGSSLTDLAAGIWVYRETGSALAVGLTLMATAVPSLIVGLLAGVYVDRHDRKRILIVTCLVQAVIVALIAVVIGIEAIAVIGLYGLILLNAGVKQFFDPAYDSLIPEMASDEELTSANSFLSIEADRALLAERFGVEDAWPVVCEPFTQWALEDSFSTGRPPLQDVGVQMVKDVEPYELMKLRLLNASHQALCYLGYLAGYRYAHEVAQDPLFTGFLLGYMDHEATPTLAPVPGVDLRQYKHQLIERFANPEIRDTLARLCAESSDRIPKWLLPVIRDQLATGGEIGRSALVVAAWARYAEGQDEQGQAIEVVDRLRDQLVDRASRQHEEPLVFISDRDLFGDLIDNERFVLAYRSALDSLHSLGARATLAAMTEDQP